MKSSEGSGKGIDRFLGWDAMDMQFGESVDQATVMDINQQVKMAQEVCSQDGVLQIYDNEGPLEQSPRFRQRGHTLWVAIGDWLAACREGPVEE